MQKGKGLKDLAFLGTRKKGIEVRLGEEGFWKCK